MPCYNQSYWTQKNHAHFLKVYDISKITLFFFYRNLTDPSLWFGVLPGGACGMFDHNNTKPYIKHQVRIKFFSYAWVIEIS